MKTSKNMSLKFAYVLMLCVLFQPLNAGAFDFNTSAATGIVHAGDQSMLLPVNNPADTRLGELSQRFIDGIENSASTFIKSDSLTIDQKTAQFKTLLETSFDMQTIARFSLGQYWRNASDVQKQEYQTLFQNMIVKVYTKRFDDYNGKQFKTTGWKKDAPHDFLVSSQIIPTDGTANIDIDWRVREKSGDFKVVDIVIAGVSMALTQRSEFSAVIQRSGGDVQGLINHLKTKY